MAIYKYVLHHCDNTVEKWFQETLGVWVSALNNCDYCVKHHFAVFKRLLNDDKRAAQIKAAIDTNNIETAPLTIARKLLSSMLANLLTTLAVCLKTLLRKCALLDIQMVRFWKSTKCRRISTMPTELFWDLDVLLRVIFWAYHQTTIMILTTGDILKFK